MCYMMALRLNGCSVATKRVLGSKSWQTGCPRQFPGLEAMSLTGSDVFGSDTGVAEEVFLFDPGKRCD